MINRRRKKRTSYSHPICKPAKTNIKTITPTSTGQDLYVQHVRQREIVALG